MNDMTKIALAVAVAGGYVLGRAKKGRLAFAMATYIAGRRFGLDPRQLATEGLRRLKDVPQVAVDSSKRPETSDGPNDGVCAWTSSTSRATSLLPTRKSKGGAAKSARP